MRPTIQESTAAAVWTTAIVAVVFILRQAGELLIPVMLALLFSYALEPLIAWLRDRGVPRQVGAGAVLAILVGAALWGVLSLRDDARRALEALPKVAERARTLVWDGTANPARQLQHAAEVLEGSSDAETPRSPGRDGASDQSAALGAVARQGAGSAMALAGHVTVIVFLTFFLLISGTHFRLRLIEVGGSRLSERAVTAGIIDDINVQIQRFLLVRLVTGIIVGMATWAVLALMNVGQAAIWGILAGAFNSIPYFGPIIVSGGLLVVGLVQSDDIGLALRMSGAALAITSIEGWLLTPVLLGRTERMHVVVVFLGLLLWTWIWGAWGTILAVPMMVMVKAVADHVASLKPLSRLMAP
jgi:predicted PurR-regulated permease PerM